MINAPGKYSVKIDAAGVTIVARTRSPFERQRRWRSRSAKSTASCATATRTVPPAADQACLPTLTEARQMMAAYAGMEKLVRLGAYCAGMSAEVDEAIRLHKPLKAFLAQGKEEATSLAEG